MEALRTTHYRVDFGFGHASGAAKNIGGKGVGGLDLSFLPVGAEPWIALFARGLTNYTHIVATPSERHCCVVADGAAYLVDVKNPDRTIELCSGDIVGTVGGSVEGVLVLISFTDLIGVLPEASWWRTERLASDGVRNVKICGHVILGEGWSAPGDKWVPFEVESLTGRRVG